MAQAMRVEALSSSALLDDEEAEDLWHVAMAPGEVKIISLERLDDLFRLSIIDESTLVWQPGMKNWVPLGVIAGLDEEAESQPVASSVPTTPFAAPPPRARSAPPPPRPVSVAPNPFLSSPPPAASAPPPRAVSAPPPRVVTAPPPRSVPAPMPLTTTDAFGLVTAAEPAPSVRPVAPVSVPPTLRPFTVVERPTPIGREGGGASRWLIALAVVAGLAVTLYRNDVIRDAARSAGQESSYLKLEQVLGGPSFGTPRAIEQFSAAAPVATTSPLPSTTPVATAPTATSTSTTASEPKAVALDSLPTEKPSAAPEQSSTASDKSGAQAPAPAAKRGATAASKAAPAEPEPSGPLSLDDAIRRAAKGKGKAPAAPAKKSKAGGGFKGSGNEFDPLNGKLGK